MLKNGENRQYNTDCPFDCTKWDECVCENTALQGMGEPFFGTAADLARIKDEAQH